MCCRLRRIGDRHARLKLFCYLDFRVCFACYPPESFKIICLTCIWLKFIDTSFHSWQKKSQTHRTWVVLGVRLPKMSRATAHHAIFSDSEISLREAQSSPGAGTRHIIG